ncbi:hypothetical protein JRO89_XS02G0070500 [Xanthoceras sorbifolium]|uniref:Uncharacterized protein n=1 Tax=Xanthoceras sorbifolium TaxID=99658 RepID=A0ABQ8IEZ7_9ROSI|nr:hypothetical protein JRO89_XS02G0070500 [Xanthoceras sorbifolium]
MNMSSKRPRLAAVSSHLPSPSQLPPPRLTTEQELAVMVAALRNVVSGNTGSDISSEFFNLEPHHQLEYTATATASTGTTSMGFTTSVLPPSDLDTCQTFLQESVVKINGDSATETEFWDSIGEEELQQWMSTMMDFNGYSSDSATTTNGNSS